MYILDKCQVLLKRAGVRKSSKSRHLITSKCRRSTPQESFVSLSAVWGHCLLLCLRLLLESVIPPGNAPQGAFHCRRGPLLWSSHSHLPDRALNSPSSFSLEDLSLSERPVVGRLGAKSDLWEPQACRELRLSTACGSCSLWGK